MSRLLIIASLFALAVPTAFAAPPAGKGNPNAAASTASAATSSPSPSQLCTQQRKAMGNAGFVSTWAPGGNLGRALQACRAGQVQLQTEDAKNAAKWCKALRASDPSGFEAYVAGLTNANGKNAFGKCVSKKARELTVEEQSETLSAAKACKQMRATNLSGFEAQYGTKKNAFGKCVSAQAKPNG
jgi:hypothetical protein